MNDKEEKYEKSDSASTNNRRKFLKNLFLTFGIFISSPLLKYCSNKEEDKKENNPSNNDTNYKPTLYDIPSEDGGIYDYPGENLIVTRTNNRVYALSTICPHNQCIVKYVSKEDGFSCPCHRSLFSNDGSLKTGISPRGLDRYKINLIGISKIEVNTAIKYTEKEEKYLEQFVELKK